MDNTSNNNIHDTAGMAAAAVPLSSVHDNDAEVKPLQGTPELVEHDTRERGVWQFPVKAEDSTLDADPLVKAEPASELGPAVEAERGALAGPERIQAYAKLEFPFFNFYIQKLSVTIGRRPPPSRHPSEPDQPAAQPSQDSKPEAAALKAEDPVSHESVNDTHHQQDDVKAESQSHQMPILVNGSHVFKQENDAAEAVTVTGAIAKRSPPGSPQVKKEPDAGSSAGAASLSAVAEPEEAKEPVANNEGSQTDSKPFTPGKADSPAPNAPFSAGPSRSRSGSQAAEPSLAANAAEHVQAGPSARPTSNPTERFQGNKVYVDVDLGPIKAVSRDHARLFFNTDAYHRLCNSWCIGVNGRNGLVLDGKWHAKDEIVRLRNGARIQIAERIFRFILPSDVPYPSAEESPATEENYFDYGYAGGLGYHARAGSSAGSASPHVAGELVYGSDSEDLRSDNEEPSRVASEDAQDDAAADQYVPPGSGGKKGKNTQPRSFLKRVVGSTSAATAKKANSAKGPSKKQLAEEKKNERLKLKEEKAAQREREKALKDAEKERKKQERLAKEQEKQQKKQEAEERRQQAEREAQARALQDKLDRERFEREARERHEQDRAQSAQNQEVARSQAGPTAPQLQLPAVAAPPVIAAPPPRKIAWTPTNPFQGKSDKPPYSFAALIAQAIMDTPTRQATLQHIFSWLPERYPFFKLAGQTQQLQAAIRRDLAVNRAFLNIPLPSGIALWAVEPEHAKFFDGNTFLNPPDPPAVRPAPAAPAPIAVPACSPAPPTPKETTPAQEAPAAVPRPLPVASTNGTVKAGPSITVGRPSPLTYTKPPTANGTSGNDAASMHDSEGYLPIVMHDNVLYLSPLVFASLTAQQLANLQTLETKKALEILQAFVVNYFKQELKRRKKAEKLAAGQRSATPISTPGGAGNAMKRLAADDLNSTPAKALKAA